MEAPHDHLSIPTDTQEVIAPAVVEEIEEPAVVEPAPAAHAVAEDVPEPVVTKEDVSKTDVTTSEEVSRIILQHFSSSFVF